MLKKSKWITVGVLIFVVISLSVFLLACEKKEIKTVAEQDDVKNIPKGGTVNIAIWSSPKGNFNPLFVDDDYDMSVATLIYEGLVKLSPNMEYEPCLSERFEVSTDKRSVTFYLRKDVQWNDGEDFTAEDVAFTFKSLASPKYNGPRFAEIDIIEGARAFRKGASPDISGIEVIDDDTIKITTEDVYGPFMTNIGTKMIIPKHIWEKKAIEEWTEDPALMQSTVGTGPFILDLFEKDKIVAFKANETYWKGRPNLDQLNLVVANLENAEALLYNAEVDLVKLSQINQSLKASYESDGYKFMVVPQGGYQFMGINNRLSFFQDKRIRQAFAYAIDRKLMIQSIMGGNGEIVNAPLPAFSWAMPETGLNEYVYNPEMAKELIGKTPDFAYQGETLLYKGNPLILTLKYPSGYRVRENTAIQIKRDLELIGVGVDLAMMDFNTLMDQVIYKQEFELFLLGTSAKEDPDNSEMWRSDLTAFGGWNTCGFINLESDRLLDEGKRKLDRNERKKIYAEWAKLMNDEMPVVYLYSMNEGRVYNSKLKNVEITTFSDFYNVDKWYWSEQ